MLGKIDIPRLNLTDLIKRDNSITCEALLKEDAVNKLRFSSDSKTFPFDITDFDLLPDGIISSEKCIVKKYLHKPSRNIVAVKYVHIPHSIYKDLKKEKDMQKLIQEIKIHQQLSFSKHIVKLYGFCVYEGDALICMEIMDMSLKEFYMGVHQKYGYFSEDLLGVICVSIVHAFQDLHKVGIIHRDIKPNNILINSNSQIKLCDFGEARLLENNLVTSIVGTVAYWPPERMEGKRAYDGRSDIWSLGITLAELVYGRFPFEDEDGNPLDNQVMVMCYIMRLNTDELVDKCFRSSKYRFAQDFVKACLQPWKQRLNYEDLLFTPFYKESCELSRHALIQQYYQSISSPQPPSSTCSNTSSLKERRLNERMNKHLKIITNIQNREFQLPTRYILGEIVHATIRGVTRKAFDQKLNKNVAIKQLRFHYLKSGEAYREFVLLQILDHRNIIKLYDAFTPCETQFYDAYFVLDYLEYPLRALIYERQKIFDGQDGRLNMAYVLSQILAGVNYLHHIGIVHRDLSPDSIIVSKDFQLKIAHLGLVQTLSEDRKELANYNTSIYLSTQTYYRAPEVLLGFKYNYKGKNKTRTLGQSLPQTAAAAQLLRDPISCCIAQSAAAWTKQQLFDPRSSCMQRATAAV